MVVEDAAPLEVLEAMQTASLEDRVRTAEQTLYQALIDAKLTASIVRVRENAARNGCAALVAVGRGGTPDDSCTDQSLRPLLVNSPAKQPARRAAKKGASKKTAVKKTRQAPLVVERGPAKLPPIVMSS